MSQWIRTSGTGLMGFGPCEHPLEARELSLEHGQPVLTCVLCWRGWHLGERITTEQARSLLRQIAQMREDKAARRPTGALDDLPNDPEAGRPATTSTTPARRWSPGDPVKARREDRERASGTPVVNGSDDDAGTAGDER
jgi:hypothetical protein